MLSTLGQATQGKNTSQKARYNPLPPPNKTQKRKAVLADPWGQEREQILLMWETGTFQEGMSGREKGREDNSSYDL
jgi:hypothetical protein